MRHFTTMGKVESKTSFVQKILLVLPVLCILSLGVTSVIVNGQTVGDGSKIRELDSQYASLISKERELESTLSEKQSIISLKKEAELLGYVPVLSVKYIGLVTPVASR